METGREGGGAQGRERTTNGKTAGRKVDASATISAYTYIYMYTHTHMCVCVCVYIYMCVCVPLAQIGRVWG